MRILVRICIITLLMFGTEFQSFCFNTYIVYESLPYDQFVTSFVQSVCNMTVVEEVANRSESCSNIDTSGWWDQKVVKFEYLNQVLATNHPLWNFCDKMDLLKRSAEHVRMSAKNKRNLILIIIVEIIQTFINNDSSCICLKFTIWSNVERHLKRNLWNACKISVW